MNYSIILLGATISLSLFLRICDVCDAMEVDSSEPEYFDISFVLQQISKGDETVYGWLTGDRDYHWKSELKRMMLSSSTGIRSSEDELDKLVDEWMSVGEEAPSRFRKHRFIWNEESYDEICGSRMRNESQGNCSLQAVISPGEVPPGCFYVDEARSHLSCNDTELTKIPPLPSQLGMLDFQQTKIKELHIRDFGHVSIEHIRFFQNDLSKIDTWAFEKVKSLKTLNIINNKIEYLAFEMYMGLTELESLKLDQNRITFSIYENCGLRPIEEIELVLPKLKLFSLAGNPLTFIPSQMWAGLRKSPVNTLNLSSCSLESIHPNSLSFLPQLKNLDLSKNPDLMSSLLPAFEGLRNTSLEQLSLAANNLKAFPKESLAIVSRTLQALDLNMNNLDYITRTSITEEMVSLKSLSLENCGIRSIDIGTLEQFPKLSILLLQNNRLLQMPPSISFLTQLTYLNLDNNHAQDGRFTKFIIPPSTFLNLKSLTVLSLAELPIWSLTRDIFQGLTKLSVLILDDAGITSIEDGSFTGLASLKSLTMKNNPLKSINSLTFYGIPKLQGLYLQNCCLNFPKPESDDINGTATTQGSSKAVTESLTSLGGDPSAPFRFLPSLRWLELPQNSIEHLYLQLFEGAVNLTKIDLTGNKIQSWNAPIFLSNYTPGYPSLAQRQILLPNNRLSHVTDVMMEDILHFGPDIVDLSQNLLLCDQGACKLRDMMTLPQNSSSYQQGVPVKLNWADILSYTCVHTNMNEHYKIVDITDELCKSFGEFVQQPEPDPKPVLDSEDLSSSKSIVTISVSIVCVTGLLAMAVVTGYKKRVHLRYAWFAAKLNISKIPRKAKTSLDETVRYDYDFFVSYHNTDRGFVQDEFLPEVEESVDQDKSRDVEQAQSKGFRVCLHERDFEAGVPIAENIVECVDRSRKVVIVVSKKYLESQWCTYEMNLAYHRLIESRRNSFLLLFLEEIPTELRTKVLNYLMRSRTYLEWPGTSASTLDKKRFWSRLTTSLSTHD